MRRFGGWTRAFAVWTVVVSLAACEREQSEPATAQAPSSGQTAEASVPVPEGEPPADVVRALMFEEYEELEKLGGLPATVSASGKQLVLRAKLFEATKKECRPQPQRPAGEFECSLTILVSITGDGSDPADETPSEQGARIGIKWDAARGRWVRG